MEKDKYTTSDIAKEFEIHPSTARAWGRRLQWPRGIFGFTRDEYLAAIEELRPLIAQGQSPTDRVMPGRVVPEKGPKFDATPQGKPLTNHSLKEGAVCIVHRRFPIAEHRGKFATLVELKKESHGLRNMSIEFEDGSKCNCTTEDISPSRFWMPEKEGEEPLLEEGPSDFDAPLTRNGESTATSEGVLRFINRRLAQLIRETRLKKGWNQQHLADFVNLPQGRISQIESARYNSIQVRMQILLRIGVPLSEVVSIIEEVPLKEIREMNS